MCLAGGVLGLATFLYSGNFSYENQGNWSGFCNIGSFQSPIDLVQKDAKKLHASALSYYDYNNQVPATFFNNNFTLGVFFPGCPAKIRGSSLPEDYFLNHIEFHWESEHTIEDKRYPLEVQFVHYTERFSAKDTFDDVLTSGDGISIISVLFEEGDEHDGLQEFINKTQSLGVGGNLVGKFKPDLLLPKSIKDRRLFFRYEGSLTTPNCYENVYWSVLMVPLKASSGQLNFFQKYNKTKAGVPRGNNRNIQDVDESDRTLYTSKLKDGSESKTVCQMLILTGMLTVWWRIHLCCY